MTTTEKIESPGFQITATVLSQHSCLDELPKRFPNVFLVVEDTVSKCLACFAKGHEETIKSWECVSLSNGGFYMRLRVDSPIRLFIPDNYFFSTLSADAASIIINLYAYSKLSRELGAEFLAEHYTRLRRFASFHIEGRQILEALN